MWVFIVFMMIGGNSSFSGGQVFITEKDCLSYAQKVYDSVPDDFPGYIGMACVKTDQKVS